MKNSGQPLLPTMCTLVGAEGGVTSLDASVVRVTALLSDALRSWSSALTVNEYVVDLVRCRRTTVVSAYQFTCWVTWAPLAKMRYVTKVDVSSSTRFHVSRTCEGPSTTPERAGAGGAAVSGGVVTVKMLLFADVFRLPSTAVT